MRRLGRPLRDLISREGSPWRFRPLPAVAVFLGFNGLFAMYVALFSHLRGGWPVLGGLAMWQRLFMVIAVPVQAAFCEELIWRGYLVSKLERQGRTERSAILLAALSFAFIHGIFLPGKLLVTFLMGAVGGVYYARERNLVPLMASHLVVDVWGFALSVFTV